jgi:hypothetical protein
MLFGYVETLHVNGNELEDLPEEMGELASLGLFYVNDNQLHALPNRFGWFFVVWCVTQAPYLRVPCGSAVNWGRLVKFYCNDNQLSQLPEGIGQGWKALEKLYLNNNSFSTFPLEVPFQIYMFYSLLFLIPYYCCSVNSYFIYSYYVRCAAWGRPWMSYSLMKIRSWTFHQR